MVLSIHLKLKRNDSSDILEKSLFKRLVECLIKKEPLLKGVRSETMVTTIQKNLC